MFIQNVKFASVRTFKGITADRIATKQKAF